MIAAQRTGRRCHGLELEPKYVDTPIRRFEALGISVKLAKQSEVLVDPPREELPAVLIVPEVSKSIEEWMQLAQRQKEEVEKANRQKPH